MRPEILFPLFAEITTLPGVGPRLAKHFQSLVGDKVLDLCWHLPSGLIDRRYAPTLAEAHPDRVATLHLQVGVHEPARSKSAGFSFRRAACTASASSSCWGSKT